MCGVGNILGEEDIVVGDKYSSTVTCNSQFGEVMYIKKEDFLRL